MTVYLYNGNPQVAGRSSYVRTERKCVEELHNCEIHDCELIGMMVCPYNTKASHQAVTRHDKTREQSMHGNQGLGLHWTY